MNMRITQSLPNSKLYSQQLRPLSFPQGFNFSQAPLSGTVFVTQISSFNSMNVSMNLDEFIAHFNISGGFDDLLVLSLVSAL